LTSTNEASAVDSHSFRNSYPVTSFLDPALYSYCSPAKRLCHHTLIPPEVDQVLGNRESRKALVADYFKTANRWLPIICRHKIYASMTESHQELDVEVAVVMLAMKLVLSWPDHNGAHSTLYAMMKRLLLTLELAGTLSMQFLQSSVLVAMYEMGHGILPSAFTSIACCARYAKALGIASIVPVQDCQWMELEERNRTWWAILILDRMTNVPFGGCQLSTPDPAFDTFLPVDEASWETGVLPSDHPQTLISTPSFKNGRYARLAQAVNLLSRVFVHVSNPDAAVRLDLDSVLQLERTLIALVHLAAVEEKERSICCLSSMAVCYR
jgi:uncharacterized membrane protein